MHSMIRRLYCDMMQEEGNKDRMSQGTIDEIKGLLENLKKSVENQEYMECRDTVFLAASAAEENGFVQGFKYAFQLFAECIYK